MQFELLRCAETADVSAADHTVRERLDRGFEAFTVEAVLPPTLLPVVEGGMDVDVPVGGQRR